LKVLTVVNFQGPEQAEQWLCASLDTLNYLVRRTNQPSKAKFRDPVLKSDSSSRVYISNADKYSFAVWGTKAGCNQKLFH
jgi:hypothetical protein